MVTFDLEERTTIFASSVRDFLRTIPRTDANKIYINQLLRSSGSVGANYLEANDALGKRDFLVKIRTSRREAKESRYWLRLIEVAGQQTLEEKQKVLIDEAEQLVRILSAICKKME